MGKHVKAKPKVVRAAVSTTAAAMAIAVVGAGVANADPADLPSQGGVTSPSEGTQGGVTSPSDAGTQGAVTSIPTPEPVYWGPAPAEYVNPEYRALPGYDYGTGEYTAPQEYVAPVTIEQLHLPTPTAPVALIVAPRNTVRFGEYHFKQPNWFSDEDTDRTNNTSALIEAEVSRGWRSVGIETDRADRLAAAQVGAGATGAIAGAAAAGVPAAVVGGLIGGTIGGIQGAAVGAFIPLPPPLPEVTTGVAGTAAGAAIGAAVAGVPAAAIGAVVGGASAVAAVTPFAAGDKGEPIEVEVNDIDQPAITAQTEQVLEQWESNPVGAQAVQGVRDAIEQAPAVDKQIRAQVAAQPGLGQQAVDSFDQLAQNIARNTATLGLPIGLTSDAVQAGIQAS
ncbi:insoluble domain protein [Rhodococcus sp. NPDC058481]|uniref:insoluble domain protein n=1 Tax=unclassified Rhodococcus (in: high G+C Gram-positive bacteria) TaxID=192944 RepID=UPI003649D491